MALMQQPRPQQARRRRGAGGGLLLAAIPAVAYVLLRLDVSLSGFVSPSAATARPTKVGCRQASVEAAVGGRQLTDEEQEQMNMLCVTLLQRVGTVEDIVEAGDVGEQDNSIDYDEFRELLSKIDLECTAQEAKDLFATLDADGSGTIELAEFRSTVRNSGAIQELYASSLRNVGFTLIPAFLAAAAFAYFKGINSGIEFATGYVVEDSLSVDNLFVFLAIFKSFKVPPNLQSYCLNVGIVGAVVLRALFISAGLAAVQAFKPFLLLFAGVLLYASYTALADSDDDDEEEGPPEIVQNLLDQLPTSNKFEGERLFTEKDGSWLVTPLFLCIIAIELCDILFAVDSIPAVFAVTDDPLIVFSSNIAAILGLRSLYQVLSIAVQDLVYLESAVAIVLGFVGLKLGLEVLNFEIDSLLSLGVIVSVLGGGVALSLLEGGDEGLEPARKQPTILKVLKGFFEAIFGGSKKN